MNSTTLRVHIAPKPNPALISQVDSALITGAQTVPPHVDAVGRLSRGAA